MKISKTAVVILTCLAVPAIMMAADPTFTAPTAKDGDTGEMFVESLTGLSAMMFGVLKVAISIIRQGATMLAFAFGAAGYFMGSTYVRKKQEQNQGNDAPQLIKIGIPIASSIMGLAVVFVVIGIFGKIFLGYTLSDSWKWAVTSVLTTASGTTATSNP